MTYTILQLSIHLICIAVSFFALSGVKFELFCDIRKPMKVQALLILSSMALGYLTAQLIMTLTVFNGF